MKIIESEHLKLGSILTINPGGLENSERMSKDGVVYFGKRNVFLKLKIDRKFK